MGNSLGGMESYVRLADEFDQYQGGFIWDYMDQALRHTDALGRSVLGYAATLRTATPITTSAATALSTPTVPRNPPCRTCATGTTPARRAAHDARNAAAAAWRTAMRPANRPPASPAR